MNEFRDPNFMPQAPTEEVGGKWILAIGDGKNLLSEFIKYANENGWNITVEPSDNPDTFEKIFGFTTKGDK